MLNRRMCFLPVVVLIVPACGRSDAAAPEMDRYEEVPVRLEITVKGDVDIRFRGTVQSQYVARRVKDESGKFVSEVVGVQPVEPVRYGNAAFLVGAAILPFSGNGNYVIPVGSMSETVGKAQKAGLQPEPTSNIQIDWWLSGNIETDPERYEHRSKPCQVVIEKLGARGTVTCPDVTDAARQKHVSVTLRWVAPTHAATTPTSIVPSTDTP
jgi:hypothetical protein